jgi:hypothetical protein
MSEENNKSQNEKQSRRFDQQQYEMLLRCSEKKDMTEWNKWREEHPDEDVLLEGANLQGANLKGANLQDAILWEAILQEANLRETHLQRAKLVRSHLQGAEFGGANLEGTDFSRAIVDGGTLIWRCEVNRDTKFEGVVLDAARIYPKTKQLLEYNIRRMNWEEWYEWEDWFNDRPKKQRSRLSYFLRKGTIGWFWQVSDYGRSTGKIVVWFFGFAFGFACVYYIWGLVAPPGIVDYLFRDAKEVEVAWWLVPIRAIHFSVVIMTVGFTNMHANAHSFWAHILVGLQMIFGFVLLGALVTRFAVLFTAGGPAGKFADGNKKEDADNDNNKVS